MKRKLFTFVTHDDKDEWPWAVKVEVSGKTIVVVRAEDEADAVRKANLLNSAAAQWADENSK